MVKKNPLFRILTKNHLQLTVFCHSLCGLLLTVCFVKVARYLLPSDRSLSPSCRSLSPSGLSLSPSLGSLAISFVSLAISFRSLAISFLRVTRYLLPSGLSLFPSSLSLSPSFGSLAISFLQVAHYLLRSGRSLIVVSFVWFAVLFRSTSPFFTVSFLPCFGILCVSLAIFSHLQNAQ